jgi:hypothetical protein
MATCAALCAALGAGGCGGGGGGKSAAGTTSTATTTTPTTTATAPTRTAPRPRAVPPATTPRGGPNASEPIRVPATFALRGGRLTPATITVPPFLAIAVGVRNADSRSHAITVRADRAYRLVAAPGRLAARMLPGQRAGSYPVLVDGARRGTLTVGGEPGP